MAATDNAPNIRYPTSLSTRLLLPPCHVLRTTQEQRHHEGSSTLRETGNIDEKPAAPRLWIEPIVVVLKVRTVELEFRVGKMGSGSLKRGKANLDKN